MPKALPANTLGLLPHGIYLMKPRKFPTKYFRQLTAALRMVNPCFSRGASQSETRESFIAYVLEISRRVGITVGLTGALPVSPTKS